MANQTDLLNALRTLYGCGQRRVRGGAVAELLWPGQRTHNAKGQVFPLGAGVAGRMLKGCKAVKEVAPGEYEILSHRLGFIDAEEATSIESRMKPLFVPANRKPIQVPDYGQVFKVRGEAVCVLGNSLDDDGLLWCATWIGGLRRNLAPSAFKRAERLPVATEQVVAQCEAWARAGDAEAAWWLGWWYDGSKHAKSTWYYIAAIRRDRDTHGWALGRVISDALYGVTCEGVPMPSLLPLHSIEEFQTRRISADWEEAIRAAEQVVDVPVSSEQVTTLMHELIGLERQSTDQDPLTYPPRQEYLTRCAWRIGVPTANITRSIGWNEYVAFCEAEDRARQKRHDEAEARRRAAYSAGYEAPRDAQCPYPAESSDARNWDMGRFDRWEQPEDEIMI